MAYTAVDSTVLLFLSTDQLPFLLTFGVWTVQPTMQIQLRNFVFMLVAASAIALAESVVATEGEATPSPLLTWPLPPLPWRGRPHPPPVVRLPAAVVHPSPPLAATNAPVASCLAAGAAAGDPLCAYAAARDGAYESVGDREQALAERLAAAGVDGRIWIEG